MAQEFFSLPSYPGYSPNPVEAVSSVPPEGLLQIVLFASWLEIVSNKGKVSLWMSIVPPFCASMPRRAVRDSCA